MSNNNTIIVGNGYLIPTSLCDMELADFTRDECKFNIWFDSDHVFLCVDKLLEAYDPEQGAHDIEDTTRDPDNLVNYIELYKQLTSKYPHENDAGVELILWNEVEC